MPDLNDDTGAGGGADKGTGGEIKTGSALVDALIAHILERGSSVHVVGIVNGALALLLLTLGIMAIVGGLNIHVVVMAVLAVGLCASVNWFVYELKRTPLKSEVDAAVETAAVKKRD